LAQHDAFRFAVAAACQARFEAVEPREFLAFIQPGVIGNIVGDADEFIEGENQRAVTPPDDPLRHWEILVAVAFAGTKLRARVHGRLGALT
jgi:hypothetical protein